MEKVLKIALIPVQLAFYTFIWAFWFLLSCFYWPVMKEIVWEYRQLVAEIFEV